MPKFGMTMKEGTVVEWPIALGVHVDRGETVVIVETEKAEVEVESPAAGFLRHVYVEPGETVACGSLLAALTERADEAFDIEDFAHGQGRPAESSTRGADDDTQPSGTAPQARVAQHGRSVSKPAVAPAARALARKLGIDPASLVGSGPGGRVTRADVQARADVREGLRTVADGVAVEVVTAGRGDPVLLLPGFGTDVSAYARQTPVLAERYLVLAMNPRGVGESDAPAGDGYGPATMAADAAAILEEPAHVIGASMGAAAAVELALEYPRLVRSLTLITPALRATPRLRAVLQAWCAGAHAGPEILARILLPWLFSEATLADERTRERTRRGLTVIASRTAPEVLESYAAGFDAWAGSRDDDLAALEAATLVLAAEGDLVITDAGAATATIAGTTVVVVPGSGHALALEAPDVVNESILEHLAGRRPS